MLFTTSKENLNNAVNAVQKAINPKSIIPIYSCFQLEIKEDRAIFTGAGLDVSIECTVPVQTEREGIALVPARYFGDIIRRLPDIPITLEHTDSMEMAIRYEKSIFTLKTQPFDNFPSIAPFEKGANFSVPAETFKKLVRQSSFAASADEMKAVFTGILFEIDGEEISLIGSDTHRLAWTKGAVKTDLPDTKASFVLSARIVAEIARLIQNDDCHIQVENNTVFFAFDNIRISCQIMNGNFPNYRQVLPSNFITNIQVDSKRLRDAVERISLFATSNDISSTIYFEIGEGALTVHSQSDIGYGREEISITHEGEDLNIAFNSRYISDIFKVIDGDTVDIQLSGQISAGIMKEKGDPGFLYLVLPVKV